MSLKKISSPRKKPLIPPWVLARKISQVLALILFFASFIFTIANGSVGYKFTNIFLRIDPLIFLSNLLSSKVFLSGTSFAILILLSGLLVGRAWCGWLCPLGTLLEFFTPKKSKNKSISNNWRKVKYGLLFAILAAALLGNLTLLFLDPITILIRTLAVSVWPALNWAMTGVEGLLYPVPAFSNGIAWLDGVLRPAVLPTGPVFYRDAFLYAAIFVAIIALNWLAPRFWCRYLCPLGAMLGFLGKFAIFRCQIESGCKECGLCVRACPTGAIQGDPPQCNPAECIYCMECKVQCASKTVSFAPVIQKPSWTAYDPKRREMLASMGAAVAGVAVLGAGATGRREDRFLLRPPGGRENDLISKCVRCGQCMRVCPTGGLQPAVFESGIEGLWTPILIPSLGYCDYSCNACGQVCPVEAIPSMELEQKRTQVLGKAYINTNRCIPWSDGRSCIVCEEMCPIPDKAIYLEDKQVVNAKGETVSLQLPHVDRDKCIGCGICEFKCPVNGEAAIRVYVPGTEYPF